MAKNKTPSKKPDPKTPDEDQEGQEGSEDEDSGEGDEQETNQRINAIVTSRVKREMKAVNQQLTAMMAKLESMATPKAEDTEDDEDSDDESPNPKAKKAAELDPKLARKMQRMENELKEEREARKKAEQAQKEEQAKAARQEMVGQFDAALTEHGVTDPKLRRAALMSLEADGYMVRDEESGKIRFKGVDKWQNEQMLDPKAGIKQWVLTEGKSFIPAVEAGGSGTGGARIGIGNTNLTKGEYGKLSPQQKASIDLERASSGLPPLE